MNNGQKPATKQDLDNLKKAVAEDLSDLKKDFAQDLARLEEKLLAAIHDAETRLKEELLEAIHDRETRLLKAFYTYAEAAQKHFADLDHSDASLRDRLGSLEDRIVEIEKRLNFPPAAP